MSKKQGHATLAPRLYDRVQILAGAKLLRNRLRKLVAPLAGDSVADLGGGTGWGRQLHSALPQGERRFILLELDCHRVFEFHRRHPNDGAVCANARHVPLASSSVDIVHLFLVAHHLDDDTLLQVVSECRRILRPGGTLVFCDPLWRRWWPSGRLLWAADRGEHPRTANDLLEFLGQDFEVETTERLTLLHQYLLAVARPRSS